MYIGLLTAAPSDAGGGTEVTTSGSAYARKAVVQNDTNWAAPAGTPRVISNAVAIDFAVPTANWGVVTHFGVYDAATAGNLLYWAALTNPKTINNADSAPSFAIGALTVTED
ncbi:MAG: hypothetical protein HGA20_14985 [Geobacteraceae bacterium]|nr:hypothetical protein [Geobacteraceae bacterium]